MNKVLKATKEHYLSTHDPHIVLELDLDYDVAEILTEFIDLENSGYITNLSINTQANKVDLYDHELIYFDLTLAGIDFIKRNN